MVFLFGIAYGPARPTDTYCKDWFTTEYQDRWGSGSGRRGDLATLKALGFNLVRSYYWDANNDHSAFLAEAERVGIGVEVPIANGYVSSRNTAAAKSSWTPPRVVHALNCTAWATRWRPPRPPTSHIWSGTFGASASPNRSRTHPSSTTTSQPQNLYSTPSPIEVATSRRQHLFLL